MDTYSSNNLKTPLSKKVFDDLQLATPSSYFNAVVFTEKNGENMELACMGKTAQLQQNLPITFVLLVVSDACNPFESDETFDNSLSDRVCCTCYDKGKVLTKNNQNVTWTVYKKV